ncbi:MAG: hypothetical protein WC654_00565 [Patescibacteria group bacterium]
MPEYSHGNSVVNQQPTVNVEQASLDSLSSELATLKDDMKHQRDESRNIIQAVVVAALLIFVTIGVEVIIFHTR